uniref:Secreted protein n=1 Tax=Panagrellus redivivus TaxID=6233 RepID=A0A7E4W183_PANRE
MTLSMSLIYQVLCIAANVVKAADVAREVEGGVQLLNPGPIQLIVAPDVLSFTIKNIDNCIGLFKICYVFEPTKSRDELRRLYRNVGGSCPQDCCTLWMDLESKAVFGLGGEVHNNNFYGMLVEGNSITCPRYAVNGRSNFTVVKLPNCPVIVDVAQLPKDEETNDNEKSDSSMKWIIAICVGLGLLLIIAVVVGFCLCMRLKKKPVYPANSVRQVQQTTLPPKTNGSPKTPASKKTQFHADSPATNDDD